MEHSLWQGNPKYWDEQALISIMDDGRKIWPWSIPRVTCGELLCLEPEHLVVDKPIRLEYAPYVCVYCGLAADTDDHIIPTVQTGVGERRNVLTVPACRACNSAINQGGSHSITERRAIAHAYIARKNRQLLNMPDYTPSEVLEFEGSLRSHVRASMRNREVVRGRLSWPESDDYDLRAMQRSGIDNPYAVGLLT